MKKPINIVDILVNLAKSGRLADALLETSKAINADTKDKAARQIAKELQIAGDNINYIANTEVTHSE